MSVSVRCPGCDVICTVPAELLGRTGRCNQCGRRIRLATPTAELLDPEATTQLPAPAEELPLDDMGELEPIGELPPLDTMPPASATVAAPPRATRPPVALPPAPEPTRTEKPAPRPKRPAAPEAPPRRSSNLLLAVLALVGLLCGSASGALLVKYLIPVERPKAEAGPPVAPPSPALAPTALDPKPEPKPPEPKPPGPNLKPPEPNLKPPDPPEPKPAPVMAGQKKLVKLPGPALQVAAGGGGRFIVFQTAAGEVVVYDAALGQPFWTLNGAKPDDLIAVGRTKLFLGRAKDAEIARFDLATGASEGSAKLTGAVGTLKYLAMGSASDGPFLVVTKAAENSYRIRLVDPMTFGELTYPIDDPTAPTFRGFSLNVTGVPQWVAAGADGRVLMLGNRYFVRNEDRYKGGLLPNTGNAQHLPATDGLSFVGSKLYGADGTPLPQPAGLPVGTTRRYIPAASGPFVVSAEYKVTDPSVVKLSLHLGTDPNPLGPLPGGDEVAAWAKGDAGWASKLHQRLVFAPDPGVLIFCPPGADSARVWPIGLPGMLGAAGRDVAFTSTPAAEARPGTPYTYRATAYAARGAVTFALVAGPPGMTVTRDGVLSWPRPTNDRTSHEVTLAATDGRGGRAVQTFRLLVPRKGAEAEPPK